MMPEVQVLLKSVPEVLGVQISSATELLSYLAALNETAGAAGAPRGMQRVLASKACRGAVMFGDPLARAESQALAESLKVRLLSAAREAAQTQELSPLLPYPFDMTAPRDRLG